MNHHGRSGRFTAFFLFTVFWLVCLAAGPRKVLAENPSLSAEKLVLAKGQEYRLFVRNAGEKVTWKSSNQKVAEVTDRGKVSALRPGKAKIRAIIGSGEGRVSLKCSVTVRKGIGSDKKLKSGSGRWKTQNGRRYYLLKNGSMAVGVRKISGVVYAFDENGALQRPESRSLIKIDGETYYVAPNGRTVAGWHVINKKLYYMDSRGKMLKDQVVEEIRLLKSGAAKKSDQTTWQMLVSRTVDELTDDTMTREQKLRACWEYLTSKRNFTYGGNDPKLWKKNWWKEAAYIMLYTHRGNCYHCAATFAAMAHTLGHKAYVVSGEIYDYGNYVGRRDHMVGHGWDIIDGKYYDPEIHLVGAYLNLYGLPKYDVNPHNTLEIIRYAE